MKYLLDTNVISEVKKEDCNPQLRAFLEQIPPEDTFLCALSIGEIGFGVERLPPGKKKHDLAIWLYTLLPEWFRDRIVPLDEDCMLEWGRLLAQVKWTLPYKDSLIASAAISRRLVLVTRNTRDFEDIPGLSLINPWEAG